MLITRLYLRNFRVYEDELDLHIPPGLVGIYGPNGSGKSTLLEAILFTLWGKARTAKEQIRSAGTGGDCVTEVEFEHEGHLYLVRRTLRGVNSAVTVEAHCDGALMSTGVRDAERYVESVLGMDDTSFRASVFTEQKQLSAFSSHSPAERRRLVMQLLGITPLDAARDTARREARELTANHERLRSLLVELDPLQTEAEDAAAAADAAERAAAVEKQAASATRSRAADARERFEALDRLRQAHDAVVAEGRAARDLLDAAAASADRQRAELAELAELALRLEPLEAEAAGTEAAESSVALLAAAVAAAQTRDRATVPGEPTPPDTAAMERASQEAATGRERLAAGRALDAAAAADVERARQALARSASLSGEADCPVCGQALGDAFEKVQAHRAEELAAAEGHLRELRRAQRNLEVTARAADAALKQQSAAVEGARQARAAWEQKRARYSDAQAELDAAWAAAAAAGAASGPVPATSELVDSLGAARTRLEAGRLATAELQRIRGRLEGRPRLQSALEAELATVSSLDEKVQALRDQLREIGFDRESLDHAAHQREAADVALTAATEAAHQAELTAARERERAAACQARLDQARREHAKLADLAGEARHVTRAAELLSEFRNTVVASVGPRLAVEAAELFAELTDHEYERLEVDPDTYELQISDGGRSYGLDRFSGSEIDLANLALRVAISEHIHFQSGGSVGLLVLDEVFGPLDEDRKARMLLALERLKGRFRQVLVVTHDSEIKDQLPNAIEVVKLPGRRATARATGD